MIVAIISVICVIIVGSIPPSTLSTPKLPGNEDDWKLVWSDEFDTLDATKWKIMHDGSGGGNNEAQFYVTDLKNVSVKDGILKIMAIKENYSGKSYTSGKLVSHNAESEAKNSWTHGYFKIRAKIPKGTGTWPAIWMLPENPMHWPDDGEIDIMENVGKEPDVIHCTLHSKTTRNIEKFWFLEV